jgi:CheY-like chemotaxis protein
VGKTPVNSCKNSNTIIDSKKYRINKNLACRFEPPPPYPYSQQKAALSEKLTRLALPGIILREAILRRMNSSTIKSILFVDDDQDDKFFFATALEEVNPDVKLATASDGSEALAKLEHLKPDLILLDLAMPGMNGIRFLKEAKKQKKVRDAKVIIYTADLSIFQEHELLKLGAHEVCIKPVDFDSTVARIRRLLSGDQYLKSA